MELVTEYLILIEKEASEALYAVCDNIAEFNKLLQTDSDILVGDSLINYKRTLKFAYEVKTNKIEGKAQRFFLIKFTFSGEEKEIEEYTKALHSIRKIVCRVGLQPETLRDDVSMYYSQKAYPLIHYIENLMRKLITYFMSTKVGKEWLTQASPGIVQEAISKSKRKQEFDRLHQLDFIQLNDVLFERYTLKNGQVLYEILDKVKKLDDLNLNQLKDFVPKSNWERYFSKIVNCTDAYLGERWRKLYVLRCKIAHSTTINKSDYDDIVQLVEALGRKLQIAIDKLDKIHIPEEERERVAENVASKLSGVGTSIDKLARIASEELKSGEDFKASAAGKLLSHDAGGEFVDCFIGATEHRIIVLIKSLFSVRKLTDYAFTQVTEWSFFEKENRFYFTAANEHYVLRDVMRIPNPKDLSNFIKAKRIPEYVAFEATGLTMPIKK